LPYTITGEEWGDFLCGLYDVWIKSDTRRVSIRLFDSILSQLVEGKVSVCHMGMNCCQYFLVEYNGDIYPCDFFVQPELKLGNITDSGWDDLQKSLLYQKFGGQKNEWNRECSSCEWKRFCAGDCLKHRVYAGSDSRTLSWLCRGWKQFYAHALEGFQKLADDIRVERVDNVLVTHDASKGMERVIRQNSGSHRVSPGRNDPCPCGSGLKYKHCCLKKR